MKYLIELVADAKGVEPAITAINELNAKEKELKATTGTVSAEQKKMMDAYATQAKLGKANIDKLVDGYKQLGKAATGAFGKEAINGAVKATESYRSQLRLSRDELTKLLQTGKATTSEIYNMARGAGQLKDAVKDAQQVISVLSSDTFKFDAALQGLQVGAAGFQVLQGSAALFGSESEELQKTLVKLNGIMALTAGLQQIVNLTQKESALRLGLSVATQKIYTTVVGESTGALAAFRLVLATVTGVAIIAGLVALVMNWQKIKDAISGTNEQMRKATALRSEASKGIGDEIGQLYKLKAIITDQSISIKTRNEALSELKKLAPEYTKSIHDIGVSEQTLNDVIIAQTELLIKREEVRILSSKIAEREINRNAETEVKFGQKINQALFFAVTNFSGSWKQRIDIQKKANEKLYDEQTKADKQMLEQMIKSLGEFNFEKEEETVKAEKQIEDKSSELYRKSQIARRQLEAEQEKIRLENLKKASEARLKIARAEIDRTDELYRQSQIKRRELEAEQANEGEIKLAKASEDRFNKRREQIALEIELEKEKQKVIRETSIQIAQETADTIFSIVNKSRNDEFNLQIQRLNDLKSKELSNKELTDAQRERIELRYQKKIAELKTRQAIADRNAAIAQAIINGALAITRIIALYGGVLNPFAIASIVATAATTALQIATISSTKIPKFAKGTEYVIGGGTETSDSVPAMLSRGERVIDAKTNKLLKGIPNKLIPDLLIPKTTMIQEGMDYDKMAKAFSKELANNPGLMVNFDKQGFTSYIKSGVTTTQIKNNRNAV